MIVSRHSVSQSVVMQVDKKHKVLMSDDVTSHKLKRRWLALALAGITITSLLIVAAYSLASLWNAQPAAIGSPRRRGGGGTVRQSRVQWSREFFPSYTESTLEVQDMNRDGVMDVIMAQLSQRTYVDGYAVCPRKRDLCKENFGFSPCRVRLLAMSGTTGKVIWDTWTDLEIFAIRCSHDLNRDTLPDCVVAGRAGTFAALNGRDGSILWSIDRSILYPKYNFYFPLMVDDLDGDGVVDLINIHGGDGSYEDDQHNRSPGFLIVVSGRTGQKLMERLQMPDGRESYTSPVLFSHPSGSPVVVFGTGGETISGSLWAVTLASLKERISHHRKLHQTATQQYRPNLHFYDLNCYNDVLLDKRRPKYSAIFNKKKQYSTDGCSNWGSIAPIWNTESLCMYELVSGNSMIQPPTIVDVTGDGKKDLVVTQFGDRTLVFNGATGNTVWDLKLPGTQGYSVPAPIYFNSDDTPDIIIRPNKGKWMHYDYSYLAVADGRTGDILWTFNSSFLAATSPVTILNRKRGYDGMVFLTSGKTREQEGGEDRMSRRGTCARSFVAADRRTCTAQLEKERSKRHEEEEEEEDDSFIPSIPLDLWTHYSNKDRFPDPWTDTETFLEEYCGHSMDSITTHLYFVTPQLVKKGDIRPLYTFKPYVFNPAPYHELMRRKRHGSSSPDDFFKIYKDRHKLRCAHMMVPVTSSFTPVLEDFDKDGRLEVSTPILWSSMIEYSSVTEAHPPKVIVKTFTLEDRFREVYGDSAADLVDFSTFLPPSKQPWKKYMGSKGSGEYTLPATND